jgi:phosphoribosylaminoimidazole-succinocarboxamide synthase
MYPTLKESSFVFPNQTNFYKGKVRDVYTIANKWLVMIATDRISAFDVILPRAIPFKGQILNQIAYQMLKATEHIVPNWLIDSPDPIVSIGKYCKPFKVEMVVRGYLAGHAAREYKAGKRVLCGISLPDGLNENDPLPSPIITPTTKATEGHDLDISREEIITKNIVNEEEYALLEKYALELFKAGTEIAEKRGLILVDTKYEFGKDQTGTICVIDEIHTPDSSRYFYKEGYEERQKQKLPQKQLSKEFVRQWLIENNFQGKLGQTIPEMTDDVINSISMRYIELYEQITGKPFVKPENTPIEERIYNNIINALSKL